VFATHIRPMLLHPQLKEPSSLWINRKGYSLSFSAFGKQIKGLVRKFHPAMDTSIINWRRQTITDIATKKIRPPEGTSHEDFFDEACAFMNVTKNIARTYYNRQDITEGYKEMQALINQRKMVATSSLLKEAKELVTVYSEEVEPGSNILLTQPQKMVRLPCLVLDNKTWQQVYTKHCKQQARKAKQQKKVIEQSPCTTQEAEQWEQQQQQRKRKRETKMKEIQSKVLSRHYTEEEQQQQKEQIHKQKIRYKQLQAKKDLIITVTAEMEGYGRKNQSIGSSAWKHFEVKKLTDKRVNEQGNLMYYVKWRGFREKTWEPALELYQHCPTMVAIYESIHWNAEKAAQSKDTRQLNNWKEILATFNIENDEAKENNTETKDEKEKKKETKERKITHKKKQSKKHKKQHISQQTCCQEKDYVEFLQIFEKM